MAQGGTVTLELNHVSFLAFTHSQFHTKFYRHILISSETFRIENNLEFEHPNNVNYI